MGSVDSLAAVAAAMVAAGSAPDWAVGAKAGAAREVAMAGLLVGGWEEEVLQEEVVRQEATRVLEVAVGRAVRFLRRPKCT